MISELLCTDVLAIRCIDNFVFVGIGCTLYIFNKSTYELEQKIRCLYPYNIHGIIDGPNDKLAVFGANTICIYNVNTKGMAPILQKCSVKQLEDWIIATKWLKIKDCIHLAVLLAHNIVHTYNIFGEYNKDVQCEEKCILYGGSISVKSSSDLMIFSGTVFQEILIWEVKHNSSLKTASVLHRLTGHNGVIFSVIYDPETQLICSTSDDRTVRLWKVINNNSTEAKDTNWERAEVKLTKTMFGHTARVWRSVIRNETLITIGEDSLICTWSLDGRLLNKVCAHHGAAIWSIDIPCDSNQIFTGGADGAVHVWPLISDYIQNTISLPNKDARSMLKYICYLCSGTLLIFNEEGVLFRYNRTTNYLKESLRLERYSSYCVMQVSPCRSYVCFASRDGYIAIYKETNDGKLKQILEENVMESQIFSLQWLDNDKIVVCGAVGILKVLNFTVEGSIHVQSVCLLPPSRERWLTAAIIFEELLVCGDRAGNMHVFELQKSKSYDQTIGDQPIQSFTKIHGRIGVQDFAILGSKLMSAGRDGMLRFYELRENERLLYALHKEKMPMDWISGALKAFDDILVLGFKEVEFLIYSMFHRRVLARIPCGGGHRSWDCILINESITFAYVRSKQVFLFDSSIRSLKPPVLLNGFHTKEVYCVQPLIKVDQENVFISGGEDGTLRVTSVINTPQRGGFYFRTLGVFDGHISSIKSISTTSLRIDPSCTKHLVFSGGGRAQIKVWEINVKYSRNELQSTDVSCSDITSHMLYGLDRHRRKPWQETSRSYVMQPETRYMDIHIYRSSKNLRYILLFVACGDGYVRIFLYDTESNQTHLKICAKCVDRCILKISIITCEEKVIALTMSTDGIVRFIDFTNAVLKILEDARNENQQFQNCTAEPFAKFNLHQSGINAFDLKTITEGEYLLATGGDDNLFSLISFKLCSSQRQSNDKEPSVLLLSKWNTSSAHSAQITGIKFKGEDKICTVGIDQQIIVYCYEYYDGVLSAKMIDKVLTFVTDVQGLVLLSTTETVAPLICVYGKGFEILSC